MAGEDKQQQRISRRRRIGLRERKKQKILLVVFACFGVLFLFFAYKSLSTWLTSRREQAAFDELATLVGELSAGSDFYMDVDKEGADSETAGVSEGGSEAPAKVDNNEGFAELLRRNGDFFGWISIDGTAVNYPVMYTPDDPEYYLHRGFDGEYAYSGVPFLGEGCGEESDNFLIFGHNMKNGTMFASLKQYESASYRDAHPLIRFDTLTGDGIYEVIAAFREKVHYQDEEDVFRYYDYGGVLSEEEFDDYVKNVRALSFFDSDAEVSYGDKLVTLSTCDYYTGEGRFVVVAKEIS